VQKQKYFDKNTLSLGTVRAEVLVDCTAMCGNYRQPNEGSTRAANQLHAGITFIM